MNYFNLFEMDILGIIFIIILFIGFGFAGGFMARNNDRSFGLGFLLGLLGNITGLIIIAYIGSSSKKRKFDPDFNRSGKNIAAIEKLSEMNKEGQLSDEEFEKLKNKILK